MMFPAKLPTMLTMTAVVISGRGERFERDLFAGQEYWGLNNVFPALRDGELALRLWAHRITLGPTDSRSPRGRCRYPVLHTAEAAIAGASCPDCDGLTNRVDA